MISLTSTNHGEKKKISAKRSRQKRWAGVAHFVIQAAVTGVSMTGSIKLGTQAWYTWRVYLRDGSKRRRGCKVLRFPQGFPQRRAVAAPDKAGGQGAREKRVCGPRLSLRVLTPGEESPAARISPGAAPAPPPRPALLSNRSPRRLETLSPRPERAGACEDPRRHGTETDQHGCSRAHEPRGPG